MEFAENKKEPLWKLNLIFTDFEILFRNGKPLKWFTFKKKPHLLI